MAALHHWPEALLCGVSQVNIDGVWRLLAKALGKGLSLDLGGREHRGGQDGIGHLIKNRPDRCTQRQETEGWEEEVQSDSIRRQISRWGHGSVVEAACCFCRRLKFSS